MKRLWRYLCVAMVVSPAMALSADRSAPLIFGVFPYLPTAQLEQLYAPVAADLSVATGRKVRLRTRPSFDLFREELMQQHYDLIFVQPFTYEGVARQHGYKSIARPSTPLEAIFIVRSDSRIQSIGELRGATLSMPPRRAAVSLLGNETLREHGLVPGRDLRVIHQTNHAACLRSVLIHKADACITAPSPLKILSAHTGVAVRVLASSDQIPGSTYAVHKRLPAAVRVAIADRIVNWHRTESGRTLLELLKFTAFTYSSDDDYLPVRRILDGFSETRPVDDPGGHPHVSD